MIRIISAAAVLALIGAAPASGQSELTPRTAVSFTAGVGSASSTTGLALGGSALFDVNPRVTLEGQGTYLDRGTGARALSVTGGILVNLVPARERGVPYLAVGAGAYRASFDLDSSRFFGPIASQLAPGTVVCAADGMGAGPGPGAAYGPGTGTCPATGTYWGGGQMGTFYSRRLGPMNVPASGSWGTRRWIDPAISLGGGIRLHATDRLMIRPDVRAVMVLADGATHTVAVFGVNVGYRF